MIVILLGYMGVGKSVIGQQLSQILNYPFVDLDDYIEKKEKLTVSEIFHTKGEIYFRKHEHLYLKELISSNKKMVLSLGGGTPCYANNMSLLNGLNVRSFYLQLSPIELSNRLFLEKEGRPLIKNISTLEKLTEFIGIHLFERQFFYTAASFTVNVSKLSKEEITEAIVNYLY